MDYKLVGGEVRDLYNTVYSKKYRHSDLADAQEVFHKDIARKLHDMCVSFGHPINVLDVGCGTGRYFYALANVSKLTGLDVSQDMLNEAKHPLNEEKITIKSIELTCGDLFQYSFPTESFDLVYSIGVLGEHSPFDESVCNKIYDCLRPGGRAFITIVDAQSMWKRKIAEILYPFLPGNIRKKLHYRRRSFYLYKKELELLLKESNFNEFHISRTVSTSSKWKGAHFECTLVKK